MTFLKNRLVFVDVALEEFREIELKSRIKKTFTKNSNGREKGKKQAAEFIITPILSFAAAVAAAAAHEVLPPTNSIALLRDVNRPSVVWKISREDCECRIWTGENGRYLIERFYSQAFHGNLVLST